MKDIVYEKDCIILNVQLAIKRLEEGDIEMAAHRAEDARRSIEEMLKQIKKPTDEGTSIGLILLHQ